MHLHVAWMLCLRCVWNLTAGSSASVEFRSKTSFHKFILLLCEYRQKWNSKYITAHACLGSAQGWGPKGNFTHHWTWLHGCEGTAVVNSELEVLGSCLTMTVPDLGWSHATSLSVSCPVCIICTISLTSLSGMGKGVINYYGKLIMKVELQLKQKGTDDQVVGEEETKRLVEITLHGDHVELTKLGYVVDE